MKRTILTGFMASVILGAGVLVAPEPAHALSKEEIFRRCTDSIKKEFGEAKVEFNSFRRSDDREWAFGELEMSDGTMRKIRCQVKNLRKLDVKFRGDGGGGAGSSPWTNERPENAGFIKREESEPQSGESDQDPEESTAETAATGPVRRSVGGDDVKAETPNANDSQSGGDAGGDAAAQNDPDQAGNDDTGQQEEAETSEDSQPQEEERTGPVFRKVVTQ